MRNGKGKFYRALKVNKITRKAIKIFNEIKQKMITDTNKQRAR